MDSEVKITTHHATDKGEYSFRPLNYYEHIETCAPCIYLDGKMTFLHVTEGPLAGYGCLCDSNPSTEHYRPYKTGAVIHITVRRSL
jgi:hypothetical protein